MRLEIAMAITWVCDKLSKWTITKSHCEYQRKFKALMLELS
jgi:hypothetical protein